jgi:hypothetical protein
MECRKQVRLAEAGEDEARERIRQCCQSKCTTVSLNGYARAGVKDCPNYIMFGTYYVPPKNV